MLAAPAVPAPVQAAAPPSSSEQPAPPPLRAVHPLDLNSIPMEHTKKALNAVLQNYRSYAVSREHVINQFSLKLGKPMLLTLLLANKGVSSSRDMKANLSAKIVDIYDHGPPKQITPAAAAPSAAPKVVAPAVAPVEIPAAVAPPAVVVPAATQPAVMVVPSQVPIPAPAPPAQPKVTVAAPKQSNPVELLSCSAIFLLPETSALFGGDWQNAEVNCNCQTDKNTFLQGLELPAWCLDLLSEACGFPRDQLVDMLHNFGDYNIVSGCKNALLMQIRTLLLEQSGTAPVAAPSTSAASTSSASSSSTMPTGSADAQPPKKPKLAPPAAARSKQDVLAQMAVDFGQNMQNQLLNKLEPEKKPAAEEKSINECCICFVEARKAAFIPCGHAVCCEKCAAQVKQCPICRKKITKTITLYYA